MEKSQGLTGGVAELIMDQEVVIKGLGRILPNYQRLGKSKYTIASAEERLRRLRDLRSGARDTTDYFAKKHFEQAEETFEKASDFFCEVVASLGAAPTPSSGAPTDRAAADSSQVAQLPRIPLPKFAGGYTEWPSFKDQFESLVNNNRSLHDVQRLQYLKGALEGEAASEVAHYPVTAANFGIAWAALVRRFDQKRLIVTALLASFLSIPPQTHNRGDGLASLRRRTNDSLAQLKNLGRPVDQWDDLLVYLTVEKLDPRSREEWVHEIRATTEPPSYCKLDEFLEGRVRALGELKSTQASSSSGSTQTARTPPQLRAHAIATATGDRCPKCSEAHSLFRCPAFRGLSAKLRWEVVERRGCCFNCLRVGHSVKKCISASRCLRCDRRHHSLLHEWVVANPGLLSDTEKAASPPLPRTEATSTILNCVARSMGSGRPTFLLATALVWVATRDGGVRRVRALLDQGSEATFVSESLVQALRLPKKRTSVTVTGAGDAPVGRVSSRVELTLRPTECGGATVALSALVLRRLTSYAPETTLCSIDYPHLEGLVLADSDPSTNLPVDIIVGADRYGHLIGPGLRRGDKGEPIAQETVFGWVVSGPIYTHASEPHAIASSLHCRVDEQLSQQLRLFWELEEVNPKTTLSPDESRCEQYFKDTVARRADGRYVVRLPFRAAPPHDLGSSRNQALSMLRGVERRLSRDSQLEVAYREFLEEYERLDHMEEAPPGTGGTVLPVYLPHHPVVKRATDGTPRVRVVFNASSRTSNGLLLNDLLLPGPKLQRDIFSVLLRWRVPRFAIKADIEKMFRQIRVHEEDADLQRILWRREPRLEPVEFRLTTVTYGTACAPYLAQRVLQQLATEEGDDIPRAKRILLNNFYVDDALCGADDVMETAECRRELAQLLHRGGFSLSKWAASTPLVLCDGPGEAAVDLTGSLQPNSPGLGVDWSPCSDSFGFTVAPESASAATRRAIVSTIARLSDPLGWVAPAVVQAQILVQELWLRGLDWDAPLPDELSQTWHEILHELPCLSRASVPRWFGTSTFQREGRRYELHGFSDASARAYGAVVYLVTRSGVGDLPANQVTLVASRTRVAPLKTVSIPRLELCAAALLAELLRRVVDEVLLEGLEIHAWSDSRVVLAWLARTPSTWTVFVANRVSRVHDLLPGTAWRHVPTRENPADCASHGLLAGELLHHPLWWRGPAWLAGPRSGWPQPRPEDLAIPEQERRVQTTLISGEEESPLAPLPSSISSWAKLLRVTALCFRFVAILRSRCKGPPASAPIPEVRRARVLFPSELKEVSNGQFVSQSSPLRRLNPFIDDLGLLRVGGRLDNSARAYDEKHPVLLPRHPLVDLLVRGVHLTTLHGGPLLTLTVLRRTYWLLGARETVRRITWSCVTCARHRATPALQVMVTLPSARVTPSRPFSHVGVDYAGPLWTRMGKGRGYQAQKSYVGVFVCFATRAVHLELISDCTTAGFLSALRRFVSRRGRPSVVYSDNGTNFRGAQRELATMARAACSSAEICAYLDEAEISWHFNTPGAPHFGGLWEAGVKSVKHHLVRIVGTHTLTFEEMCTLLCSIEACLNSRPLTPMSRNPEDYAALTPGHFLIGAPLLALPGERLLDTTAPPLSRWQGVEAMRATFWKQWSREYLHTLQERSKWWRPQSNLQPGELVVVRDPNAPPARWRLARVEKLHAGSDGRVRVVTIRNAGGSYTRPITQLVRMPVDTTSEPSST